MAYVRCAGRYNFIIKKKNNFNIFEKNEYGVRSGDCARRAGKAKTLAHRVK